MKRKTHVTLKPSDTFIEMSQINWDTSDGAEEDEFSMEQESELNLPSSVTYQIKDLLLSDESLDSVGMDELEERAIDKMCDEYGFCIYGCAIAYGKE